MALAADPPIERDTVSKEIGTAVRHTFVYGIGGILTKALSFLLLPLFTHYLSPRDYGVLEIIDLSMSLLGMFLNMGITASLLRYYGAAESEQDKRKVVGTLFRFTVVTGLLIFAVGALQVNKATLLLFGPGVPPKYLLLSFASFVLAYIANIPYTYLRAKEASGALVTLDTVTSFVVLVLNIVFIAVFKMSILGMLLSPLMVGTIRLAVLIKWMGRVVGVGMDWILLRGLLAFGAPLVLSDLTGFIVNFSDRFFLQRYQSLEIVGIYAVGYKFAYMLNFLFIQPFNMMWHGRMYVIHRQPNHRRVFAQVFVLYSVVLMLAALGLALFSSDVIRVMADPRYAAGEQVIGPVALGYVFLGMSYYVRSGMFLVSRTGLVGIVCAVAAAVNLVANYFLISNFGMLGAAWATLLGFCAIAVGSYYCSQRVCPLDLAAGRVVKALALAIGIYVLSRGLRPASLAVGLLLKGALLASFPAILFFAGMFSPDEIATLRSLKESAVNGTARLLKSAGIKM